MSQSVRISCRSFLSRIRISVWPSNFFKLPKSPKNRVFSWSPVIRQNGDNLNGDNCGHNGDRLSQNSEKATSKNGDNESLYLHSLTNLISVLLRSPCICSLQWLLQHVGCVWNKIISYISNTSRTMMILPSTGIRLVCIYLHKKHGCYLFLCNFFLFAFWLRIRTDTCQDALRDSLGFIIQTFMC